MCGRFAQPRSPKDLARIFRARATADLEGGRYNVAPTDEVSGVVERKGERLVDAFRWGLLPHWATSIRDAARRINARAETIETSPAYRVAFARRRCILPAEAFYEWRHEPGIGKRVRAWPFAIERVDREPMAMAAVWATWREPLTALRIATLSIVTTVANDLVASIHDRMPVILEPSDWDVWLSETTPVEALRPLLVPSPAALLRMRPVSVAVNDVRNDGPELLATREDAPTMEPLLPPA
jgi:putative SOS response-associated peptidase YedK